MSRALRIVSGGISHPFAETSRMLAELLAPQAFAAEIREDAQAALSDLAGVDLLVLNMLRWRMQGEKYAPQRAQWAFSLGAAARAELPRFLARGGGLLALHAASLCFDDWPEWPALLGGAWVWGRSHHPPVGPLRVEPSGAAHPLCTGLPAFELVDECYCELALEPGVTPLLLSSAGDGAQPLVWARQVGAGRVIYDALGHDERSLAHPVHRRLLARAARWACGASDAEVQAI